LNSLSSLNLVFQVPLKVVDPLDNKMLDGLKLRLAGDHQFTNAGLAVSLCKYWLQRTGNWEKLFQNVSVVLSFLLFIFCNKMLFSQMVSESYKHMHDEI